MDEFDIVQEKLIDLFTKYDLNVAVGLTKNGIAIRSQDPRVDCINVGEIRIQHTPIEELDEELILDDLP